MPEPSIDYCGDSDPAVNGRGLWECPDDDCGYQTDVEFHDGLCPFDDTPMKCIVAPTEDPDA